MPSKAAAGGVPVVGVRQGVLTIPDILMGKQSKSYTVHEIKRILQHFHKPTGDLSESKEDALRRLTMLEHQEKVTRKERIRILKGSLDRNNAVRYQERNPDGSYSDEAFPAGLNPNTYIKAVIKEIAANMPGVLQKKLTKETMTAFEKTLEDESKDTVFVSDV